MEGGGEAGSEKQVVMAAKKLARSGSKNAAGGERSRPPAAPVRGGRGHCRRWSASSTTDLDNIIETAPAVTPTPAAAGTVLGRSYSTAAKVTVAAAVDGGVKKQEQKQKQKAAGEVEGEEQRPRSFICGAGARISRNMKEHRARFYIVRRCIAMLVCWRDDDE